MESMPPAPRTVVFGRLDGSRKATKNDSDSSSDDSKENPLLNTYDGVSNNAVPRRRRIYPSEEVEGEGTTFCRCVGHLLALFMPVIAMTLMLTLLSLLVRFDHQYVQDVEVYENANMTDIAEVYFLSVQSDSVSYVLSQYEPYAHVLALSCTACVLISMVTVARNIQIEVYHKRTGSRVFMKFINYMAAIINIFAYIGLMIAVNFKATQETPDWSPEAHYIGFLMFFVGTATYALLHQFLLWKQAEYPLWVKILFFLNNAVIVGSSFAFALPIWESGWTTDEYGKPVFEWVAVFASAINIGMYVILFFLDPADDQVTNFFCGSPREHRIRRNRSGNKRGGGGNSGSGKEMRRGARRLREEPVPPQRYLAYNMQPLDSKVYQI